MAALHNAKTLAKTLTYLLVHASGEHGLYWDEDGSMPWRELYWAMQEDPSLRFVRETHLREIDFLGIDFPAILEGNLLRLKPSRPVPDYPIADAPPPRLFIACRKRQVLFVREHGLAAAGRPFLAVTADKDLALRIARRRDPTPVLIEILVEEAVSQGIAFRSAGGELYLAERLPAQVLRFPLMSEERLQSPVSQRRKEKTPEKHPGSRTPGSFMLGMEHMHDAFGGQQENAGGQPKGKGKGRKGAEWKRAARKERTKRSV
jgi:putative RNA 2'-phosphotransferase